MRAAGVLIGDAAGQPGGRCACDPDASRNVTVGASGADHPPRALIRVSISDAVHVGQIPIRSRFSTGSMARPSAGLAFALSGLRSLSGHHLLARGVAAGGLDLAGAVAVESRQPEADRRN